MGRVDPFDLGDDEGFFRTVEQIYGTAVPTPTASEVHFEYTVDAAEHNAALLASFEYDMDKLIDANMGTTLQYGSEVRPMSQLQPLLRHHPDWTDFEKDMTHGIDYPFEKEISESERLRVLEANIERGNHKSALKTDDRHHVTKLMTSDVELGYAVPVTLECVRKLKDAEVYPIGLQNQMTIDADGNVIPKKRATHDLSHNRSKKESVNQRVDKSDLPPAKYGHALNRFIHLIHHIRRKHPGKRILCNKFDVEKAYRRLHTRGKIAAKCIAVWFFHDMWQGPIEESNQVGLVLTRLPFGASPAPPNFCRTSEIVFDLANDLLVCEPWDPIAMPSPHASLLPAPKLLEDTIPFGATEEADVTLPDSCVGGVDGYIDDGACAVLDTPKNRGMVARAAQAVVMALFLIFRPLAKGLEVLVRPDIASIRKMQAEGGLAEIVIFLGWLIDTHRLLIALPPDKWKAWSDQIQSCLTDEALPCKTIETLIGRLNHVCFIIPDARHFMNELRAAGRAAQASESFVKLSDRAKADLRLWLDFLSSAKQGISLNRIVFRKPTLHSFSDASEWGIGGFSPHTGVGWRYEFTEGQHKTFTLNCKEFIGLVVDSVIQSQYDPSPCPFPCYLHWSDSTSTVGWLRKSNFLPDEQPIHDEVARFHARHMMKMNACNYSQHLPGSENVVTDCFSRDFHLTDDQLITMLTSLDASLSPSMIKIVQVPDNLICWISKLEQLAPERMESLKARSPSSLAAGISGWSSSTERDTMRTPSWKNSVRLNDYASAVLSCMQKDEVTLGVVDRRSKSWQALPERPSIMWRRPSSATISGAQ